MKVKGYGLRALEAEQALVRHAQEGERNNTLSRAAYNIGQLLGGGLDQCHAEEVLFDAGVANGLREDEARATIRSGMERGKDHPRAVRPAITSRANALAEVARIAEAAGRAKWSGHQGKRMVRILAACLVIANDQGGPSWVSLSTTRVCIAANTKNRGLVQRALKELREEGWLELVLPGAPTRSAGYTLRVPPHLKEPTWVSRTQALPTHTQPASIGPDYATAVEVALARPDHDAFRTDALDTTGWRLLGYLAHNPGWHTQVDVADALGISRSTVWKWVKPTRALCRHGLIERNPRASLRCAPGLGVADFDRVAGAMNTLGKGEAHRAAVRAFLAGQGWITEDCRWINATTGEIGSQARWLLSTGDTEGDPRADRCDDQGEADA